MTPQSQHILKEALDLSAVDRAELVERILESFIPAHKEIDAAWAQEVEERLEAYNKGKIRSVPAKDVFKDIGQ
jgi:putative addiction module component (TIGR02574 family)